jgi:hypothetical protein
MNDILPDSRAKNPTGVVYGHGGSWVPFYCANCGKESGKCPEENMTFMFYLCNLCFEMKGEITGVMMVPDKVFYDKVAEEQQDAYGRPLTHNELLQVVAEDCTPLATLLKEAK